MNTSKNKSEIKKTAKDGFTLVETLIAILILSMATTAPMVAAFRSISYTHLARDQVIATFLAEDAIEYVIAKQKNNLILKKDWLEGLDNCNGGNGCKVDTLATNYENDVSSCGSSCPLKFDDGFYAYGSGSNWEDTRFTRKVFINEIAPGKEAVIETRVSWNSGIIPKSFTLKTNIYNTP